MSDFEAMRQAMVNSQIRTNKVVDELVIDALRAVPREMFVPKSLRSIAYVDEDLALGEGRYLMEPMVFARLLQEAMIREDDVVLDIGCATGYSSAVLAKIASAVVALEADGDLARQARSRLTEQGIDNAVVMEGPLADGYAAQAPYNVIIVEGMVPAIPDTLTAQLGEGGRLLAVLQPAIRPVVFAGLSGGGLGRAVMVSRNNGILSERFLFDASIPPLPGVVVDQRGAA